MSQFISTHNKGFNMTFENGISISVQWGSMNYCERRNYNGDFRQEMKSDFIKSPNAEIMISGMDGIELGNGDVVAGWLSTNTVAQLITACSTATDVEHLNEMLSKIEGL